MGKHFIIVGRTSKAIAQGILPMFGDGNADDGSPIITEPGRVIQSRFGTFRDGEAIFELFIDGKLDDHPIEQRLTVEQKQRIFDELNGADVTIIHSLSGENTSSRALGLAFGASFLKKNGVKNIRLIAPHLPFMRNDREFKKEADGENGSKIVTRQYNAVACQEFATIMKLAGIDQVVGFEPHSRDGVRIYRETFGRENVTFVNMGDFFAKSIAAEFELVRDNMCQVIVGSPDGMNKPNDFGMQRAYSFGEELYKETEFANAASQHDVRHNPCMFGISKHRINADTTEIIDFHGDVAGKVCVIIDDIISGGSTTLHAAEKLKERGAASVIAIATHAVLTDGALKKLLESDVLDKVMLTDTIPGAVEKLGNVDYEDKSKLVIETIAPLVNEQLALKIKPNGVAPDPTPLQRLRELINSRSMPQPG